MNRQGFLVITSAVADITRNIDIRQKMHFDFYHTVTATILATATLNIERKPPLLESAHLRFRQAGEQVANISEHSGIGCRIRTRTASDRRLVDIDYLIKMFKSRNALVGKRFMLRLPKVLAMIRYSVSLISVDFPEPDTPVTQVNTPTGMSIPTSLRLFPIAPRKKPTSRFRLCAGAAPVSSSCATDIDPSATSDSS